MAMKYIQLYFTYKDALAELTDEECGRVIKAVMRYATDGIPAEFPPRSPERQTYLIMASQFDNDADSYDKRSAGGKQGGRPSKGRRESETPGEPDDEKKACETFMREGFDGFHVKEGKGMEGKGKESSSSKGMNRSFAGDDMTKTTIIQTYNDRFRSPATPIIERKLQAYGDDLGVDLVCRVIEQCANCGASGWGYVRNSLEDCKAKGMDLAAYEAEQARRKAGHNVRVDRAAPSGNDILQRSTRRLMRLKRED